MASESSVLYHLQIEGGVLDVPMMMIYSHQLLKEEENIDISYVANQSSYLQTYLPVDDYNALCRYLCHFV